MSIYMVDHDMYKYILESHKLGSSSGKTDERHEDRMDRDSSGYLMIYFDEGPII